MNYTQNEKIEQVTDTTMVVEKLAEMSYHLSAVGTDSDAIFLEKVIEQEKDSELKEAFEDLDDYLFNW